MDTFFRSTGKIHIWLHLPKITTDDDSWMPTPDRVFLKRNAIIVR